MTIDLSQRSAYAYDLPDDLIAQHPTRERTACRLLAMSRASGDLSDLSFRDLPSLLRDGDLLVLNDTRVVKARLFGHKATGGRVEVLVERVLEPRRALAMVRSSKSPKPGASLEVGDAEITVTGRREAFFILEADRDWHLIMDRHGHVPLPPYIEREDEKADQDDYQTVWASRPGAVAAPTAGLHFDHDLMDTLHERGVDTCTVTLHVGAGTFAPMRADRVDAHHMHSEWYEVDAATVDQIARAKAAGGRVVAVGTTSVRALESAALGGSLQPGRGETDIFIHPLNPRFEVIDGLITNFHLPESTLIMLVAAFAGYDNVMAAYRHAVTNRYRFFSYGDAMVIL